MIIFGLKACDTCRAAVKATGAALVDIRATPLSVAQIARFLEAFGAEALVNKRSTTWRGLDAETRLRPAEELLSEYPTLMKRPVIETEAGALHLGWTEKTRAALGL